TSGAGRVRDDAARTWRRHEEQEEGEVALTFGPAAVPAEAGFVITVADAVARITLKKPDTWRWLARAGADLPGSVRVVLVTGAGPSFSSGLDRTPLADEHSVLGALARGSAQRAEDA